MCSPALSHCAMVTSGFQLWPFEVFNLLPRNWQWYYSDWTCPNDSFVLPGFKLLTSGSLVLHCPTVEQWNLLFTSDTFSYLSLVQRDWMWYCPDKICESYSLFPTSIWIWSSGSLILHSTTLHMDISAFYLRQFELFNSGSNGLAVVLF